VRYGRGLQAVELVERVVDGGVRDEMVDVVGVGVGGALRLVDERRRARKGVVHGADEGGVGEGFAAELVPGTPRPFSSALTPQLTFPIRIQSTKPKPNRPTGRGGRGGKGHTSAGNPPVKSLNSLSCAPISMRASSWFSSTDSRAWVPHAFWIVCAAKKRSSAAAKSKVPSWGESAGRFFSPVGYLKRKMTPYTGLLV